MNNLSFSEKKKLLSLARRLIVSAERRDRFAQQANNLLKNSTITFREFAQPTTNASRNFVQRIRRLENMMNYAHLHVHNISKQIMNKFPNVANMSPENIIQRILREQRVRRNILSGRYQTHGRPYTTRTKTP